ncbi:MAG: CHASE2 domain-containing protein, partial [Boseongicola sp.]
MSRLIVSSGRRWSFRAVGVILIAFGLILRVSDPFPVQSARLVYFDYLQRMSPREYTADLPVKVVDIDEASLAELGQWPWPRTMVAQLVDRLGELGAAVLVFDTIFAEPDRYSPARLAEDPVFAELLGDPESFAGIDNDQRLAAAISQMPTVLGVAVRSGEPINQPLPRAGVIEIGEQPASGLVNAPVWTGLAEPLGDYVSGIGAINVSPSVGAGVVRQVPLVWSGPTGVMPSLSIEALRIAMQENNIFVEGALDDPGIVLSVGLGSFTIPTTENGQIWVRFRRDHPDLYVSAHEVMTGTDEMELRAQVEGRIILIGTSAAGLLDIRETALGDSVPGVSIHAQIIEQILLNEVLARSDITAALELLAFFSLGLLLMSVMLISGAILSLVSGAVGAAVVLAISWYAFQSHSTLFDATFPLLGGLMTFGALASFQFIVADRDKRAIRTSLSHYVAPEILDEIERTGQDLKLGGETQEITVMFADIRDFTPISESMSATELVSLLNEMFDTMGVEI